MNRQEIFNKAYLGLRAQGRKGVTNAGNCAYNGADGTHCGIGHLISGETAAIWDAQMLTSIDDILERYRVDVENGDDTVVGIEPWMLEHQDLLERIQISHDLIGDEPGDWDDENCGFETAFRGCADVEKLEIPA